MLTCISIGTGRGSRSAGSQALAYAHLLLGEREAWIIGIKAGCSRMPIRNPGDLLFTLIRIESRTGKYSKEYIAYLSIYSEETHLILQYLYEASRC